jgi:hypothetical protein
MIKFWPFRASHLACYRQLSTEAPSEALTFLQNHTNLQVPAEKEKAGILEDGNLRSIYMKIALWLLAFICFCETSVLILQHFHHSSDLYPLLRSPVPSDKSLRPLLRSCRLTIRGLKSQER